MSPAGIEPAIPASERLQTHALDRAVTDISTMFLLPTRKSSWATAIRPTSQTRRRIMSPLITDLEEPNSLTHNFVMKSVASRLRPLAALTVPCLTYLGQATTMKDSVKAKFSLSTSWRHTRRVKIYLHLFSTSAQNGEELFNSPPAPGIRISDRPVCCKALYRLSYLITITNKQTNKQN